MENEFKQGEYATEYNKEVYNLLCIIYELNEAGELDISSYKNGVILYNKYIRRIDLISDILQPYLAGKMIYEDKGLKVFPTLVPNNHLFIKIKLSKIDMFGNVSIDFEHNFLIYDISVIEKRQDGAYYELKLISEDYLKFNNYLAYSSAKEKPCTQILADIFKQSNLELDSNITHINKNIFFVCPTTFSVMESINYVLLQGIDSDYSMYFIAYDQIKKTYKIISLKDIFKGIPDNVDIDNVLNIPAQDLEFDIHRTANKITERSYLDFISKLELSKSFKFKNFSYDKRSWSTDTYSHERFFNETLPLPQGNQFERSIKKIPNIVDPSIRRDSKEILSRDIFGIDSLYESSKKLFLYNDVIEFTTYGALSRYAGQPLALYCDEKSLYNVKYNGIWFIGRVYHQFISNAYRNVIQATRLDSKIQK